MKFSIKSNIGPMVKKLQKVVEGYEGGPITGRVVNPVIYAGVIEMGGTHTYSRKRPNSKNKIGTRTTPKGLKVSREKMTTTVERPPHGMMRGNVPEIKKFLASSLSLVYTKHKPFPTRKHFVSLTNENLLHGEGLFKRDTPVKTSNLKNNWFTIKAR